MRFWPQFLCAASVFFHSPVASAEQSEAKPIEMAVQAEFPHGGFDMAYGLGSLWMMSGDRLVRIESYNGSVTISALGDPSGNAVPDIDRYRKPAIGHDAIWIPDVPAGFVRKIDPNTNREILRIPVAMTGASGSIGIGAGSVWVVAADDHSKTLMRFDADSGAEQARLVLPSQAGAAVFVDDAVFVPANRRGELYRIDPEKNAIVATFALPSGSHLITADGKALWVPLLSEGKLARLDRSTGIVDTIEVPGLKDVDGDIAVGGGSVWLINRRSLVVELDAETRQIKQRFLPKAGVHMGRRLAYGDGALWISGKSVFKVAVPNLE